MNLNALNITNGVSQVGGDEYRDDAECFFLSDGYSTGCVEHVFLRSRTWPTATRHAARSFLFAIRSVECTPGDEAQWPVTSRAQAVR